MMGAAWCARDGAGGRRAGWMKPVQGRSRRPACIQTSPAPRSSWTRPSKHELALGRLEIVVVVELLAADELLELGRRAEVVDAELPLDELGVVLRPLARHAVDAERLHLAGDV